MAKTQAIKAISQFSKISSSLESFFIVTSKLSMVKFPELLVLASLIGALISSIVGVATDELNITSKFAMMLPGENDMIIIPIKPGLSWYKGIKKVVNLALSPLKATLLRFCRAGVKLSAIRMTTTYVTVSGRVAICARSVVGIAGVVVRPIVVVTGPRCVVVAEISAVVLAVAPTVKIKTT